MRDIHVIPWHCDFFAALVALLEKQAPQALEQADLSDFVVVFPHLRPRKYLLRALHAVPQLSGICRPPDILSSAQLFTRLRIGLEDGPLEGAPHLIVEQLDRVAVLRESVATLEADSGPLLHLPAADPTLFIPWGLRLEQVLEEFVRQDVQPQDIHYTEEHVQPFAAALLGQLGSIARDYDERLAGQGFTTPARDAQRVVRHLDAACEQLQGRTCIIAGFCDMTTLEQILFHALWQRGALMALHSDPALADTTPCHWSCREHEALLKRWNARAILHCAPGQSTQSPGPSLRFHEGFDLHSQLEALQRELQHLHAEQGQQQDTALVLPNTSLLMPALHHLPDKNACNVTMGYPLARSPLARLLDCLLRLQEGSGGSGDYYWKDLLECFRHPYIKMLSLPPASPDAEPAGLRRALQAMETRLRSGQAYARPLDWEPMPEDGGWAALVPEGADSQALRELLHNMLQTCLTSWENVTTLADAAAALQGLCDLLRRYGADLWHRFPVDAECLHRLLYNVIPGLGQSSLAQTPLPRETIFAILRQTVEDERAPFESESIEGLQLLGMLETRLLSMDTVLMLDVTDDVLPGGPSNDPLLPDSLRRLLGLPDSQARERAMAHHFFRLLHGAREVVLFYQTSVESGGLFDEKRLRSRFVEELLWQKEQELGRVLQPGEPPVQTCSYPVSAPQRLRRAIDKTGAVQESMERLLASGLSPSALDDYMHCPARFFYKRICKLEAPKEVEEEGDPLEIGTLVHEVLQQYFSQRLGVHLHAGAVDPGALAELYLDTLRSRPFFGSIPFDQRLMLEKTGPILLQRYLETMPPTTVLGLEQKLQGVIALSDRDIPLSGMADRIDRREQGVLVLDYKTGFAAAPGKSFWDDEALWERLRTWPDCQEPEALLPELAAVCNSLQLPCYCHMYRQQQGETPWDAALVELRNEGREITLFAKKADETQREEVVGRRVPELLAFMARHMLQSRRFAPLESRRCDYCDYAGCCVGAAPQESAAI